MRLTLSRSPIVALVVIAGLAAGTALLAGYVDKPSQGTAVTTHGKCDGCPKTGTEACCKVGGACEKDGSCATASGQGTCASRPVGGCCKEKAEAVSCWGVGCQEQAKSPCGAGGCAHTE